MTVHKLSAGSGYTYLTRQVAANDVGPGGFANLGDYYSDRGETPGRWLGGGLAGLEHGPVAGELVTEAQMIALFGHGRHPNADALDALGIDAQPGATQLGSRFTVADGGSAFRRELAERIANHNLDAGTPAGSPVPDQVRAAIRTELGRDWFQLEFGRTPTDEQELSDFITDATRPGKTSVAGYDLTFSPVKSVSTLWALASPAVAAQIEDAHHAAVRDAVAWLEDTAAFTRLGHNGVRQVDVTGLLAVAFTHRDSRAGDPDLHTHVAISNKVQTLDGRWRTLDGRVLFKAAVAASERYNTRLEVQLVARLGVRFADRAGSPADKQPVREIVGVDPALTEYWSSRRQAITDRQGELAADFTRRHGRAPDVTEARRLFQQASLETRPGKHAPRSESEQRSRWQVDAASVLGGDVAVAAMLAGLAPGRARDVAVGDPELTRRWVQQAAREAITQVEARRATWQPNHVRAEVERLARAGDVPLAVLETAVEAATHLALSPDHSVALGEADRLVEPAELRRRDGASVFTVAGTQLYTSPAVLAAEARLLAAAGRDDGNRVDAGTVELALLESATSGRHLNAAQADLVRELASSGARLQLVMAPAGTGKTTALGVLGNAWTDGGGTVVGLAPSATAAQQLGAAIGRHADTVAKLLHSLTAGQPPPRWVDAIDARTLLIVDEAGMAGTRDLDRVVAFALDRGASVRLVGDAHQLAARQSGGVLRDIAETVGAVALDTVVRFSDPLEAHASLALRTGDPLALGYYLDRGRVHAGDHVSVAALAYAAWSADRTAGLDALLLAPTNALVRELNQRARADRLTRDGGSGAEVRLHDQTSAGVGDTVVTRRNDRRLPITSTDWVKNGDRWHVDAVTTGGGLQVTHIDTHRRITLPGDYVRTHVELGYATTVHLAQGRTADTAHTVLAGRETCEVLYVAMTRGRDTNHVYLDTGAPADPHAATTPDAIAPPTSVDLLLRVLANEGARPSATGQRRLDTDPAQQLRGAVARYLEAVSAAGGPTIGDGGPLPWLPPVPEATVEWTAYLTARAELIADLADQVTVVGRLPNASWAEPLATAAPDLAREVVLWRVAQAVPDEDLRPCGPRIVDAVRHRASLLQRVRQVVDPTDTPTERWRPLAESIDARLTTSSHWPLLASAFTRAADSGYDLEAKLPRLAVDPLPNRQFGAELFYRLAADCPAALPPPRPPVDNEARARMRRAEMHQRSVSQPIARGGPRR